MRVLVPIMVPSRDRPVSQAIEVVDRRRLLVLLQGFFDSALGHGSRLSVRIAVWTTARVGIWDKTGQALLQPIRASGIGDQLAQRGRATATVHDHELAGF